MDLIKTVRGLDQNGPGENGEQLETLWKSLSVDSDKQFHAAEESALRWLLKTMNSPSAAAELMRRYPLTWTILGSVFQKIPLFSLAKSLADRRFVVVLQQTLRDIAKPSQESGSASPKRKRSPVLRFDLEALRGLEGCMETAQVVFGVLRSLLSRLDTQAIGPRDRIGAEHIKSLFCNSAAEAAAISSSAVTICGLLLTSDVCDEIDGREDWITTMSSLWDLHLQGSDDALEVATQLFKPAASTLLKLERFGDEKPQEVSEVLAARWSADLQRFIHRNLIVPARDLFLTRQNLEPISRALDIAGNQTGVFALALYSFAAGASDLSAEQDMRKNHMKWMNQIFQAVEFQVKTASDSNIIMEKILRQAIRRSITIEVGALRQVCRDYGLGGKQTNWSLIANAAECNPDLFQTSDEGKDLLNEICDKIIPQQTTEDNYKAQFKLIQAVKQGFRTRRDFAGFLRLWFTQLCSSELQKVASQSPWFDVGRKESDTEATATLIESNLSPHQLIGVLDWLGEQHPDSCPEALCLFTAVIAQGLRSESFIDVVELKLFNSISQIKSSSKITALRWRTVSKTIAWSSQPERLSIWAQVKEQLSKRLLKSSVRKAETFEALKCCYQIWDSMSLDGATATEIAKLVEGFTKRLTEDLSSRDTLELLHLNDHLNFVGKDEFDEKLGLTQYLSWYLSGSSRFCRLLSNDSGDLPSILKTAASAENSSVDGLSAFWAALLRNEANINDPKLSRNLLDQLITAFSDSKKEKGWPGEQAQMWIRTLSTVPIEALSREQREQIMVILNKRKQKMIKSPRKVSLQGWKLVLDLTTKMMSRATFYQGMAFSDTVELADALSNLSWDESPSDEVFLEMIERFFWTALTTVRQMAENIDERSAVYLTESLRFVSECESKASAKDVESLELPPFRITLLKVLAVEFSKQSAFQNHPELGHLSDSAKKGLAGHIAIVLGNLIKDKKLLSKRETLTDLSLFAAVDAASVVYDVAGLSNYKSSSVRKLEKRSKEIMNNGDLRAWKIQVFLHTYLSKEMEVPRPTSFAALDTLPAKSREPLLKEYVMSIINNMDLPTTSEYLKALIKSLREGSDTDGQLLAIQHVVNQLIERTDLHGKGDGVDLAAAHGELMLSLFNQSSNVAYTCRIIHALLETKPQAMGQWNIELTLSQVSTLASEEVSDAPSIPYAWLCRLVATIIKKHRLRLESRYHLLLTTLESLLRNLIKQQSNNSSGAAQGSMAHLYGRLITLICEPTAGAVSRPQHQSALDSATDAAKRSAGRHMYLLLMQYVKLQLETNVSREVREALEPAMNSILDITPPETRKIFNDAMDGSGRAILREMFKRYVKFGKWSGV